MCNVTYGLAYYVDYMLMYYIVIILFLMPCDRPFILVTLQLFDNLCVVFTSKSLS